MDTQAIPPARQPANGGLSRSVLFGIRGSLEKLSRQSDEKWKDCQFATKRIHEYGPLTTDIAHEAGVSVSTARYHLDRLWKAGKILKHLSYRGCIARWYSLPNTKDHPPQ